MNELDLLIFFKSPPAHFCFPYERYLSLLFKYLCLPCLPTPETLGVALRWKGGFLKPCSIVSHNGIDCTTSSRNVRNMYPLLNIYIHLIYFNFLWVHISTNNYVIIHYIWISEQTYSFQINFMICLYIIYIQIIIQFHQYICMRDSDLYSLLLTITSENSKYVS